jgi:magnesium transporter
MALITAVTALFAMNVRLEPDGDGKAPYSWFVIITCCSAAGALALFTLVLAYCKWRKLLMF